MQRIGSFYRGDISRIHSRHLGIFLLLIIFVTGCHSNEETRLTCMFGENMDERRQAFKLLDETSATALKCKWKAGKLSCVVGDGYTYDWTISDTVTIRRQQTSEPPTCSCFVVDADNTQYERPCVSDVVSDGNIETSSRRISANVPEHNLLIVPQENDQTHSQTSQTHDGGVSTVVIVLSVSIALMFIVAVTVVLFLVLKHRRREASDNTSQGALLPSSQEDNNNNEKKKIEEV